MSIHFEGAFPVKPGFQSRVFHPIESDHGYSHMADRLDRSGPHICIKADEQAVEMVVAGSRLVSFSHTLCFHRSDRQQRHVGIEPDQGSTQALRSLTLRQNEPGPRRWVGCR